MGASGPAESISNDFKILGVGVDLTEKLERQKQLEEWAAYSEFNFTHGVLRIDRNGDIIHSNETGAIFKQAWRKNFIIAKEEQGLFMM